VSELGGTFDENDVLLIRLADALAGTPANVSDELFAELKAHYTEEQLMEIAAFCAQENYRARWNRLADIESHNFYRVKRPENQAAD
jgi:alkylhydroperoxidase family enzyme